MSSIDNIGENEFNDDESNIIGKSEDNEDEEITDKIKDLTGLVTPKQIDRIIENANEQARDWFNRIKDRIQEENLNIKVSTKVILTGIAVYGEIIQYAEKENIDLIVIGTRGRSGVKKLLLGSTASGVVTYADCPVLVTK